MARPVAAEMVPTPVARRSSCSGDHPVGGGGLDRRSTGVRYQGGSDLAMASRGDGDGMASANRQHRRAARR